MSYEIKPYSYKEAKKLNVLIKPSTKKKYKIDVFDSKGEYITSIGHRDYSDKPTYTLTHGKEYADNRARLYKIRHKTDLLKKGSRGWFSNKILW